MRRAGTTADGGGDRVAKWLARAGVASRREAERMIAEGRIAVNGRKLSDPAVLIEAGDTVTVDRVPVDPPGRARLWRYHKPKGLLVTARDPEGRPTRSCLRRCRASSRSGGSTWARRGCCC